MNEERLRERLRYWQTQIGHVVFLRRDMDPPEFRVGELLDLVRELEPWKQEVIEIEVDYPNWRGKFEKLRDAIAWHVKGLLIHIGRLEADLRQGAQTARLYTAAEVRQEFVDGVYQGHLRYDTSAWIHDDFDWARTEALRRHPDPDPEPLNDNSGGVSVQGREGEEGSRG